MIIWGCKVYVVNSRAGKKYLDPRMSKYPCIVVGPLVNCNLNHQSYGYFMGYSHIKKVLLYYDPHKNILDRSHHAYVDEHEIQIQPK